MAADGIVITNNHVVDGSETLVVRLQDGREFDATVVGTDAATDIAVLRISAAGLPTMPLGNSDAIRVGDWVLAIGSPFREQLDHSVSAGIISGKSRGNVGLAEYEEFLQTDAAINPGNSGGPLVNLAGEVVGINTAIATRTGTSAGVSFAIPVNFARRIVEALLANGRVTRAWMGVQIRDLDPARARELEMERPNGVAIAEVYRNMPADRAGLREGDVILAIDGQPTSDTALFRNRVSLSRPGQKVELDILREGERKKVTVELGELNDDVLAEAGVRRGGGGAQPDIRDPHLGLELAEITPQLARRFDLSERAEGLVIVDVARGSVAAEAGLEPGDLVRSVNRKRVESMQDFDAAVADLPADHPLVLQVKRGSRSFFVTLERSS
jgi:serine protease Do